LVVTRRTSGILEDETGYVSRSGGHLEVSWLLPLGHLENKTGYESRSGGYLVVTQRTFGV